MSGGEDDVTDLPYLSQVHHLDRNVGQIPRKSRKCLKGFLEIPYLLSVTYLRMEINDLVMYPKG